MDNNNILLTKNKNKIYTKALDKWGKDGQICQAIQEMAELTHKLTKLYQKGFSCDRAIEVCEEIADVEIMMEQLRFIFFPNNIDNFKVKKLERLEKMVNEDE